jgi:hypothetical protein
MRRFELVTLCVLAFALTVCSTVFALNQLRPDMRTQSPAAQEFLDESADDDAPNSSHNACCECDC